MRPRSLRGGEDEKDTQGTKLKKYEMVEVLATKSTKGYEEI